MVVCKRQTHTSAVVTVRTAIVVVRVEGARIGTIVIVATTFKPRIIGRNKVRVARINPYISTVYQQVLIP